MQDQSLLEWQVSSYDDVANNVVIVHSKKTFGGYRTGHAMLPPFGANFVAMGGMSGFPARWGAVPSVEWLLTVNRGNLNFVRCSCYEEIPKETLLRFIGLVQLMRIK